VSNLLARNMFFFGIIKIAKSITELAIPESRLTDDSVTIPLAFLDTISASEVIIRACILKIELDKNLTDFGDNTVSEARKNELINGSSRLSFLELPRELERISGKSIANPAAYYEMDSLRNILLREGLDLNDLVEPTLRFTFESIEPLIIDVWEEIILLYVPELDFEVDRYIEMLLSQYNITLSQHDS